MTINLVKIVHYQQNAPIIDYKNITLLKKYVSENGKIVSSKITRSQWANRESLKRKLKRAKILGLI